MDNISITFTILGSFVAVVSILFVIWGLNFQFTSSKIYSLSDELKNKVETLADMDRYYFQYYDVLHYHNPFLLKTWFGFKHWFHPYKFDNIFEKYSDEM